MGLFNHSNKNKVTENFYEQDGYIIGANSHMIYHVPEFSNTSVYILPEGTTGLSASAIMEMRKGKPKYIIVPGSFKRFNVELLNFENLIGIVLNEGVEEVKCLLGQRQTAVDILLPKTIKKIGAGNYPIVQDLVLPNGVVEIEKMFASHDTNLISAIIPGTIKEIPQGAFNQCRNLRSVVLCEGVETSKQDAFRGTNNLRMLELPSTYNGTIALPMDARSISNARGNSNYDGRGFEEEKKQILTIKIRRGNKSFEFNIKRGEQPIIEIRQNIISIRGIDIQQTILIDCAKLESGRYDIDNGAIEIHQSLSSQEKAETQNTSSARDESQNVQEKEMLDNLDIVFQNAYRDNITKRDDFVTLSNETKMQIKKKMKTLFFQMVHQFGTINTDYELFDYLYSRVLKETEFEESPHSFQTRSNMKR